MNLSHWQLLKFETRQTPISFLILIATSLALGFSTGLGIQVTQQISKLYGVDTWNTDLIVLPKGVSPKDLASEIRNGLSTDFLPDALFETTLSMTANQLKLSAVLPMTENGVAKIFNKGNSSKSEIEGIRGKNPLADWAPQTQYSTSEWDHKVIAAFFASGPMPAILNLKQLIDRKTVAQAILVSTDEAKNREASERMQRLLYCAQVLFAFFAGLCLWSSFVTLKTNFKVTFEFLHEIGGPKSLHRKFLTQLALLNLVTPFVFGYLISTLFSFFG
jgi:hypothetical protein